MNSRVILIVAAVVILLGAVVLVLTRNNTTTNTSTSLQPTTGVTNTQPTTEEINSASGTSEESKITPAAVKEFVVTGSNFKFDPTTLTVNKGDTVKITFKNTVGMHDFVIDEFNAKTNVIGSGQEETIQFVADKAGTFEYYCSVGNHRQMGMKGTLTVK